MRFSDIHSHFVYGMDDGAQTAQEMEAMLDAAAADGVGRLIATPHMAWYSEEAAQELKRKIAEEAVRFARGEKIHYPVNHPEKPRA